MLLIWKIQLFLKSINILDNWYQYPLSYFGFIHNSRTLKNKQFKIDFILIVFLIASSFLFSSAYRELTEEIMWHRDDAISIFIADSFRDTGNFYHIADSYSKKNIRADIIEPQRPILVPFGEKGPVYFIALGSLFSILDSDASNWYQHASMLNSIFSILFLILLYSLLRKNFGIHVAFFSSLIICFLPIFGMYSARTVPIMLFLLITLSSFFFLKDKKSNFIIFGLLAGLGHLTHPLGIILPISYFLILLLNKKFRGFLIVFVTYQLILIPWYARSLYYFNDFGRGLLIPFSSYFSNFISFPTATSSFSNPFVIFKSSISENFIHFDLVSIIYEWYTVVSKNYGLEFYIIFFIVFLGFAFFKINFLKQNLKILFPSLMGVLLMIFVIFHLQNEFFSLLLIFIPLILGITIFIKHKKDLEINNHKFVSLILIYFTFSFLLFYVWQLRVLDIDRDFDFLDIRILLPGIIFLIPLSVIGFYKINEQIFDLKNYNIKKSLLVFFIMGVVITSIVVVSFDLKNNHPVLRAERYYEPDELKNSHSKLSSQFSENSIVMTNNPYFTFLRTGMTPIPSTETFYDTEYLLSYYNPSLIVDYKIGVARYSHNLSPDYITQVANDKSSWPTTYSYKLIDSNRNVNVFEVSSLLNYDINDGNVIFTLAKGVFLKNNGHLTGENILQNLIKNESLSIKEINTLCLGLIHYNEYINAIPTCIDNFSNFPSEELSIKLKNLLPYSEYPRDILLILSDYIMEQTYPNIEPIKAETKKLYQLNNLYNFNQNLNFVIDDIFFHNVLLIKFKLIDLLIEQQKYDSANTIILELLNFDRLNIAALHKQLIIYEKTENFEKANELKKLLEVLD